MEAPVRKVASKLLKSPIKFLLASIVYVDRKLETVSCYIIKYTGRSSAPIHPKNIFTTYRNQSLIPYFQKIEANEILNFLDVGSGSGSSLYLAYSYGYSVTGLEFDPKLVNYSVEKLSSYPSHANNTYSVTRHNLEEVPWPAKSNTYNLINFTNVLEHLHNRHEALMEISRLLASANSACLMSIPNKNSSWKRLLRFFDLDSRDDQDHKIEYSIESISKELSQAGLIVSGAVKSETPSIPIHGLFSIISTLSPSIYKFMQGLKDAILRKLGPGESKGWEFAVTKSVDISQQMTYQINVELFYSSI